VVCTHAAAAAAAAAESRQASVGCGGMMLLFALK